ncbi:MAG: glyoxalase [Muribaculaceae bacterium]|nr:glyoxalase [Muribaculaceae bacterium]
MDENYPDFPEYGRQVELTTPWRGYRRGTITEKTAKGFIVHLSSGAEIEVYADEIEID